MQRSLQTLSRQTRSIGSRLFTSSSSPRSSSPSSSSSPSTSSSSSSTPSLADSTSTTATPTHFLVTLLRSPLHLNPAIKSSLSSLGLYKRLSSSIVPITPINQGYILRAKELVGIKPISEEEVRRLGSEEWRNRQGEGRQGSGLRVRQGAGPGGVIRVGSERARGEERGFKVVQ